ncbi:MAG: hypothetical protein ACYYKD_08040 [Rhodospirillales bacterium]
MTAFVVDTNVGVVANDKARQADPECRLACIGVLKRIIKEGVLILDSQDYIFEEYNNHFDFKGGPGVGDAFFKWLFLHRYGSDLVQEVNLEVKNGEFTAFPDDPDLKKFDPSDRKFVAVALTYKGRGGARIQNAVDSDWLEYLKALESNGVTVDFLCGTERFTRTGKRKRS